MRGGSQLVCAGQLRRGDAGEQGRAREESKAAGTQAYAPFTCFFPAGSDDDRWTRAVYRLHATIFQVHWRWKEGTVGDLHPPDISSQMPESPRILTNAFSHNCKQGYRDWCRHVDLPERINELTLEKLRESGEAMVRGAGSKAGSGTGSCPCVEGDAVRQPVLPLHNVSCTSHYHVRSHPCTAGLQ